MFTPAEKIRYSSCPALINRQSIYVVVRGRKLCYPCFEKELNQGIIQPSLLGPFTTFEEEENRKDRTAAALAEATGRFHHHDHSPGL